MINTKFFCFFCLFFFFAFVNASDKPRACCKAANARCLSCVAGISEQEFCAKHPSTCGCPQENLLRMALPGGWTKWKGDIISKWNEILSNAVISVDGVAADDLTALGNPNAVSSQVVAGTNYKFAFTDGTLITVLEQIWMTPSLKITNVEKPGRKLGETCGYVFGNGNVGECAEGLKCACVGMCADPMVADFPSTCVKDVVLRQTQAGGWSKYEGDMASKWNAILSDAVILVDGFAADDLAALGNPNAASSQVVAGTNYKFAFEDGTQITVLEQLWMTPSVQITNVEKPEAREFEVEFCPNSSEQFCKMLCPKPKCATKSQCAFRKAHCCDYTCQSPDDSTNVAVPSSKLAGCTFEDGSSVPSGWSGPGRGDNYCNQCSCNDGALMCTEMFCMGKVIPPTPRAGVANSVTSWTLTGPFDITAVQKYIEDFEEIFADTLRVDKSSIESVTATPIGTDTQITVNAFLNPMQAKFIDTPEFKSILRSNIESTADDLAKGMGYEITAGNFILQGPWNVNAVEFYQFELQRQFAQALGVPQNLVDVEITEDDFMTKIDFTAKDEGGKLTPLSNPILFQQTLEKQIKKSNPALAAVLGYTPSQMIQDAIEPAIATISQDATCPASQPTGTCSGSLRCEYGQECCCGKCHASMVAKCNDGMWMIYYTDACMVQPCLRPNFDSPDSADKPDQPDVMDKPDTPDSVDKHDRPGLLLSSKSINTFDNHVPLVGIVALGFLLGIAFAKGIDSKCRKKQIANEDVYTDLQQSNV